MENELLTKGEIREYWLMVRRLMGSPRTPGYKDRYDAAMKKVYNESPLVGLISLPEFQRMVITEWSSNSHNSMKAKISPVKGKVGYKSPTQSAQPVIVFSYLCKHIATVCGVLPNSKVMQTIGTYLGHDRTIWITTKRDMVAEGWEFEETGQVYKMSMPDPKKKRLAEIEHEIIRLRAELDELKTSRS